MGTCVRERDDGENRGRGGGEGDGKGALTSSNSVEYLSMESCKDHCELVLTVKGD